MSSNDSLLRPLQLGRLTLKNRIIMPPMTRLRADDNHTPTELMRVYYAQRAGMGLILTEPTMVQRGYSAFGCEPAMVNHEQVEAWRAITDAVHEKGGTIFLTLSHGGRATTAACLTSANLVVMGPSKRGIAEGADLTPTSSASTAAWTRAGGTEPYPTRVHAMTTEEIAAAQDRFLRAAKNAMAAGFDGVEIDAAGGYLIDQFLRDGANDRTDAYGGSIENRCRFLLEIVDSVVGALGAHRVGVRVSPTSAHNGMSDSDPQALTRYLAAQLDARRVAFVDVACGQQPPPHEEEDAKEGVEEREDHKTAREDSACIQWVRAAYHGVVIGGGGYTPATAAAAMDAGEVDAVAFGALAVANPDLVRRLALGAALNQPDPATYVTRDAAGYTDYPTVDGLEEVLAPPRSASQQRSVSRRYDAEESREVSVAPRAPSTASANASHTLTHTTVRNNNNNSDSRRNSVVGGRSESRTDPHAHSYRRGSSESGPCAVGSQTPAEKLLKPMLLGQQVMKNRMIMGPLPRQRASADHTPTDAMATYYGDRAGMGLIVSEPVEVQPGYHTYVQGPCIFTKAQVAGWKKVTDAVHDKGGLIFCQLHHGGRAVAACNLSAYDYSATNTDGGERSLLMSAGGDGDENESEDAQQQQQQRKENEMAELQVMGASTKPIRTGIVCPHAFSSDDTEAPYPQSVVMARSAKIAWLVRMYASAARKAMAAGFDGVEVQASNGFLIDQFLRDGCNDRTDGYGGSVENRCRFLFEVVDAVAQTVGKARVGVRVSPTDPALDMRDSDPQSLSTAIAAGLQKRGVAYVAVTNDYAMQALNWMRPLLSKAALFVDAPADSRATFGDCEDTLTEERYRAVQEPLAQAQYERQRAEVGYDDELVSPPSTHYAPDAVTFLLPMVANPDLADRAVRGVAFSCEDGRHLFTHGQEGYNDYPTFKEARRRERLAALQAREAELDEQQQQQQQATSGSSDESVEGRQHHRATVRHEPGGSGHQRTLRWCCCCGP